MDNIRKRDIGNAERLVEASQAGDRGAFDELVRLYQVRAMQVAVRILARADDASEAVQAGFVRAYLNLNKLREPKKFEVWLLRIVANAAISQRRAARRRAEIIKTTDCYEDNKTLSPMEEEISRELKEAIGRAMLKLTKKEAGAVAFFGLEGLSYKDIAEIMGCSVGAVRWYVFKGRQKLKRLLKDYL